MSNDSTLKTFLVAFLLCVVCSVLVCLAALVLIDKEAYNQQLELRQTVLAAGGYLQQMEDGGNVDELFTTNFERKIVDLASGEFTTAVDTATYDQKEAVDDPTLSVKIPADKDVASIGTRAKYAAVYVDTNGTIVLPIRGIGFGGMMYGYVSVATDGTTIKGFTFYSHGETPGLGAEIDNPRWKKQWPGKQAYSDQGTVAINVVKNGKFNPGASDAINTIDGLAGATNTSKSVNGIVRYWFGEDGFAKFLANQKAKRG